MSENKYQSYQKSRELVGKTIKTSELIMAEYGRTYDKYLLFTFTDGTRHLLTVGSFRTYHPDPTLEEMRKAPNFFSIKDITEKVVADEAKSRQFAASVHSRKISEFERLKKELGK